MENAAVTPTRTTRRMTGSHCNNFEGKKPHPYIPHDKCMWNKKYKGYRIKSICNEFELDFKPRYKFLSKMGVYKDTKLDEVSE